MNQEEIGGRRSGLESAEETSEDAGGRARVRGVFDFVGWNAWARAAAGMQWTLQDCSPSGPWCAQH